MKAAVQRRYGTPADVFTVEDVPEPSLKDDEVLIRVHAAGVNWADASMATGTPYIMRLGYGLFRPRQGIRGTDVAGVVERVGSAVTAHRVGDHVFGWCSGAFAEYAKAKENQVVPKPVELEFEEAAGMAMAGCVALQAMRDIGEIRPGSRVLVNGASGGIGSLAVQIAKAFEAHVTGVCSTPNVELVRSLGADSVIDYTEEDFTRGSARYDIILDMADNRSLRERRRVLKDDGVLIPNSGVGGRWFGSIGRIFKAWLLSPFVSHRLRPFLSVTRRDDLLALSSFVDAGVLTPIVGHTYGLADTGLAIEEAGSGHARGKAVITI